MIRDGKPVDYSGHKAGAGGILLWVVTMIIFLGALFALGYWTFENVWLPGIICIVLATIAFFIPKQLVGLANTVHEDYVTDEKNAPAQLEH